MHAYEGALYLSLLLYSLLVDTTLLFLFIGVLLLFLVVGQVYPGLKSSGIRKKITLSSWNKPSQGIIRVSQVIDMQPIDAYLEKYEKDARPTLNHICIKALGEAIRDSPLNGSIAFGKFRMAPTVNISTLVDIEGKDLAVILVEGVQKLTIEQIKEATSLRTKSMKKEGGGAEHKKRVSAVGFLPTLAVQIITNIVYYITGYLNIPLTSLGFKAQSCGAGMVTNVASFGFVDSTAPFTPFANNSIILTVNAVKTSPVVREGRVQVGRAVNLNLLIDHRYLDGANGKTIQERFLKVLTDPESFSSLKRLQ